MLAVLHDFDLVLGINLQWANAQKLDISIEKVVVCLCAAGVQQGMAVQTGAPGLPAVEASTSGMHTDTSFVRSFMHSFTHSKRMLHRFSKLS